MKNIVRKLKMGGIILPFLFYPLVAAVKTSALGCKDVSVVFLRGSSQNYTDLNEDINFPVWDIDNNKVTFSKTKSTNFLIKEKESAAYFEGIGNQILAEYPALSMQFVTLHNFENKYNAYGYRAVPAFGSWSTGYISRNAVDAKFGSSAVIGESTYGDYRQSIQDGAEELAGYLADELVRCPNQYTVLGGFSQGAHVVGDALALMHSRNQDQLINKLGHVDLFGDPKFNGFKLTTSRLNPLQQHTPYPWVRGSANINQVGSLGPREPYIPDVLTGRTTSWCDFNDLVCGGFAGLSISDLAGHGHLYSDKGGWIQKASNETFIDMKTRLNLLAGVDDKTSNAPLAYWPGLKEPTKLDVMFVMDSTGDESLSLVPDPDYLSNNFLGMSSPNAPLHKTGDPYYSSIRAGVATFTELQQGDDIVSYPAVPVALTDDVYSEFGAFRTGWAQAHFLGSLYGGADLQDSPFSALKLALQQDWRDDSRHVIVLFSNSWGKDKEPVTDLTMKQITALARDKNVEILPVFTSRTLRANPDRAQFVNDANLFYAKLATQTEGHRTEVTDLITSSLVYDVIMGHVFSPDVVISKGATYANPKTKKATTTDLKNTKTVVKKGANIVLSASKSSSPTGKIIKYSWDFNGDGIIDYESDGPFAENDYTGDYDGLVCVTVTDNLGQSTTSCEQIATTDDNDQVTDEEPAVLQAPEFHVVRSGSNAIITWQPTDGYIVFRDSEGALIVVTDAHNGLFTLKDVPSERFVLTGQLVDGNNESEPRIITIAAGEVQATPAAPTDSNQTTEPSPAPPDTASDNGDGLVLETGSDAPTRQTVVLGSVQEMSDKVTLPTVAGTEGLSPASTGNSQSPRNGVSALWHAFAAKAAKIVEGIAEDYLLLLLVVLLLLIWYYLKSRRRDQETYQYDQQKRYTSRKVISLQT